MEEILIKKLEAAIRGIRLGLKNPSDVGSDVSANMSRLKPLNEGMHGDLMEKYKNVVSDWNRKNQK